MAVIYYANSNQPVTKAVYGDTPATTFAIWTPASGKSIVLTDVVVSAAAAGTIRFYLSTDLTLSAANITQLFEFIQAGSAVIAQTFDSPIVGSANQVLSVAAGFNGRLAVTVNGFEQEGSV